MIDNGGGGPSFTSFKNNKNVPKNRQGNPHFAEARGLGVPSNDYRAEARGLGAPSNNHRAEARGLGYVDDRSRGHYIPTNARA